MGNAKTLVFLIVIAGCASIVLSSDITPRVARPLWGTLQFIRTTSQRMWLTNLSTRILHFHSAARLHASWRWRGLFPERCLHRYAMVFFMPPLCSRLDATFFLVKHRAGRQDAVVSCSGGNRTWTCQYYRSNRWHGAGRVLHGFAMGWFRSDLLCFFVKAMHKVVQYEDYLPPGFPGFGKQQLVVHNR
jgi:hypothetical protein